MHTLLHATGRLRGVITYSRHIARFSYTASDARARDHPSDTKKIAELLFHDDVIKWKHFPRNWPFVREIPRTKASDAEL